MTTTAETPRKPMTRMRAFATLAATPLLVTFVAVLLYFAQARISELHHTIRGDATHPLVSEKHLLTDRGPVLARREGDRVTLYAVVSDHASDHEHGPVREARIVEVDVPASAVTVDPEAQMGSEFQEVGWLDAVEERTGKPVTLGTLGDRDRVRASSARVEAIAYIPQ